ncbi:MAG: hypothetical protein HC899_24635 [Leptolyngbyaceae cyanobacterium SM1_4_3]|nr:hypothetical protein [Leptolyngbyaceae cyanobacterium SM1_4_3]
MARNAKRSLKKIASRSLTIAVIVGFAMFTFLVLVDVCSQILMNIVYHYNAMLKQQFPAP